MQKTNIKKIDYHKIYYSHNAIRVGEFDMPQLKATHAIPRNVVSFNERNSISEPADKWIDFFIDDYKFAIMKKLLVLPTYQQISIIKKLPLLENIFKISELYNLKKLYEQIDRLVKGLRLFEGIITPDFSLFPEMPKAQRIWNCYMSRVIAYYLQNMDLNIVPTVAWGKEEDLTWCFEGLPTNSPIAISTNGCKSEPYSKKLFLLGVEELQTKLTPFKLIICGSIFEELKKYDNIVQYNSFSQRLAIKLKEQAIQKDKEKSKQYEFNFEFSNETNMASS